MTDAELIARLRGACYLAFDDWCLSTAPEAADRIEALTKERDREKAYAFQCAINIDTALEQLTAARDDAKEAEAYAEELEAKLAKAVEAAFKEGFLAGTQDGWLNNPRIKMEWKRSRARSTLAEIKKEGA